MFWNFYFSQDGDGLTYVLIKQGCSANKRGVGTHPIIAILKQFKTHFETKHEHEKGVGTLLQRVPASLHF